MSNNGIAREEKHRTALARKCDRCKPHRGENRTRTPRRSWKSYGKAPKRWAK